MSRIPRLSPEDIPPEVKPLIAGGEALMGFTMNDGLDMARNPGLLSGMSALVSAIYAPGEVSSGLKRLIGYVASTAAGCQYCQQHTAHGASRQDVQPEKIMAAWEYDTSPLFSEPERAALKIAHLGSLSPSQVTDADFAVLRRHHSDKACVEIVAVISLFGFLNRWNAVMDTEIEAMPADYAKAIGLDLK